MGLMTVLMLVGRVLGDFGCRIGDVNAGHFRWDICARASTTSFEVGQIAFAEIFVGAA